MVRLSERNIWHEQGIIFRLYISLPSAPDKSTRGRMKHNKNKLQFFPVLFFVHFDFAMHSGSHRIFAPCIIMSSSRLIYWLLLMSLYLAFYWYTVSVIISNIKNSNNKNKYTVQQLFVHFPIAVYLFIASMSDVRWVMGAVFPLYFICTCYACVFATSSCTRRYANSP